MAADGSAQIPQEFAPETVVSVTLADVLARLEADRDLDPARRRELCSAVRSVCRVLNAEPALVAAHPRRLRARLRGVTAAAAGVGQGRWSNIRSLTLKALKRVGIRAMPGRYREPHAPEWEALRSHLPDRRFASGLSRFMSYCTAHGIRAAEVDAAVFKRFQESYENDSILRDAGAMFRDTCKLWNSAVATIPGWPKVIVEVPVRLRRFALPLDAFPESFGADVERFLSRGADPDVFSDTYAKPIRAATARTRRRNILVAATALVQSGIPAASVTGLDMLVRRENAKAALRLLLARAGGRTTGYIHQVGTLLKTIAKYFVRADEKTVAELRILCSKLKPAATGLTEKNRRCLRQFADINKLAALLALPQRLLTQADRQEGDRRRGAVGVALGLAIGIELVIPIRAQNLTGLRLDRHIHHAGKRVLLSIPAEETKNENAIDAELPSWLVRLLDAHVKWYRPRLVSTPSPWLFPGEQGARRSPGGFGAQISSLIVEKTGITMTLHQFRHLAAKLYLDRRPGDYETVRRLLGHKSLETTMRFYRELDTVLAVQRYGELLNQLLDEVLVGPTSKPLRRRGHGAQPSA
jgi:integrase